jgi:hypothetical protein
MLYYKPIELENYDLIIKKSLAYVKADEHIFNRSVPNASWYRLDALKFKLACPEIVSAFKKYNIEIVMAAVYIMYHPRHSYIHRDDDISEARINLPLLNCDNTYTNFYEGEGDLIRQVNPDTGTGFYSITNKIRFVDRIEIKQATVIRTSALHSVVLPISNPVPRITLTLGMDKDPIYFLSE